MRPTKIWTPYPYQNHAFDFAINHDYCGLFLDMGLGKTVITLTTINRLMYEDAEINRTLVVAPKRVALTVWKQEAALWEHTKHLRLSIVWGTPQQRETALRAKADIFVINRENLAWLVGRLGGKFPFDLVVLDESSSFKDHQSQRFRVMKLVRPQIKRIIELSGTPAPNSLIDLWAQIYLLDQGERLHKGISAYREHYFTLNNPGERYSGYRLRPGGEEAIHSKIKDICISMKKEDYLDLPPMIENNVYIQLSSDVMNRYEQFEEDSILELDLDKEVTALNAAALTNKLLQFANGALYYDEKRNWEEVHKQKLETLQEIVEELQGKPAIICYSYKHDIERIKKIYPHVKMLNTEKDINDWNNGDIKLAIGHPASMGHGLNLQFGGHNMIWFGLNWSLELYLQARDRLLRPGQTMPVYMHRILCKGTMDIQVERALRLKERGQNSLLAAIKSRVKEVMDKRSHR